MAVFRSVFQFYFLYLIIELIVQSNVQARQAIIPDIDSDTVSPYIRAAPKKTDKTFEPLEMDFPDTKRTAKQAETYKEQLFNEMNPRARKEDKNLKITGESCARGLGDLYKVISDEGKLTYELCYDDNRSSAIYTTHVIDLANKTLERSSHLTFKAPYTLYGLKIDEKYTAAKQTHKFLELFGKGVHFTDEDTKKMNYFSRNHLTPHADFPLVSEQQLTYYFQNCVPGKQSMNQGNFSTLEGLIRAIAIQMNKILRVFTGVYGILTKPDRDGVPTELYLDFLINSDKKRIEIPLIIWKLVIDEKTNEAVAFFTSNDTDMDEKDVARFNTLCDSVCDELGYDFKKEPKSGITLCCRIDEFFKHIRYLPIKPKKTTKLLKNTVRLEKLNSKKSKSRSPEPAPAA